MKLAVPLILLVAVSQAAKVGNNKKIEEKTDKRELTEGNAGIEKRAPILPTASPALSTGVEYADSKNILPDKSPTHQMYATPVPQVAKISDLFSGQNPSYQSAIASHLYSPISIYQPTRLGQPTTYEVSAPVPSNLAYSEHRLSLPSPNAIEYNTKPQKVIKPFVNYQQPQFLIQQSYEQNVAPIQSVQQVTPVPNHQQIQYNPQLYTHQQPLQYIQEQPNQLQAGITYQQEQQLSPERNHQRPEQRDLKSQPAPPQILEKQNIIQQEFNDKQQSALSYARFSINQPPSYKQTQQAQQLILPQQQQYQQPQQHLLQTQPTQYQLQQPLTQINYQLQHSSQQLPQVQHQVSQQQLQLQPQPQYQEQPQYLYQQIQDYQQQTLPLPQPIQDQPQYQVQPQQYQQPQLFNVETPDPVLPKQAIPERQAFFKQAPILQPKLNLDQGQVQNLGYQGLPAALPTFPPVQYFGKFAQSLFGGYQH